MFAWNLLKDIKLSGIDKMNLSFSDIVFSDSTSESHSFLEHYVVLNIFMRILSVEKYNIQDHLLSFILLRV